MKKGWVFLLLLVILFLGSNPIFAQCALCTKTASQLGEKPAAALNSAIIYLMAAPFAIIGFIAWRWWKGNREEN
ncbi:MAG: hypothetical protein ACOVP6_03715 [Lacibacter sp.]